MKGQTDLKVCPFFPFSRGWSHTSAPQPSPSPPEESRNYVYLLLPLLLSLPLAAFSIKANPRPVVVSLPDGSCLLVVPGGSLKVLITAQ